MKLLITGSNGLLGQKIVNQCLNRKINFLATSLGENRNSFCPKENYSSLDIRDQNQVERCFNDTIPTHVIHTAAMTNVDQCELDPIGCQELNVTSTRYLWEECKKNNIHFQLLSTDFVFDGVKGNYAEADKPNPLSVYAHSKVDAENLLLGAQNKNWSIVRTIIVYGQGENLSRNNIVCWAKEALAKNQEMNIIDDQFRAPTWADDLAWACIRICELSKRGVFHISGPETLSIFEIVSRVARFYDFNSDSIVKTDSSTLNQPAKRPPKTGFDLTKAKNELGYNPKTLEETLAFLK
jgi:dTDP-4-dehydrorhamnose reductase